MAYRAGVVGGSGYTGAELLRLLAGHPDIDVVHVTADSNAGAAVAELYPSLAAAYPGLEYAPFDPAAFAGLDVVFLGAARTASRSARAASSSTTVAPRRRPRRRLPPPGRRLRAVVRRGPRRARPARPLRVRAARAVPATRSCRRPRRVTRLLPDGDRARTGAAVRSRAGRAARARRRRDVGRLGARARPEARQPLLRGRRERQRLRPAHAPPHRRDRATRSAASPGRRCRCSSRRTSCRWRAGILATCHARPAATGLEHRRRCSRRYRDFYAGEPFVTVARRPAADQGDARRERAPRSPSASTPAPARCSPSARSTTSVKGASGQALQSANLLLGLPETAGLPTVGMMP